MPVESGVDIYSNNGSTKLAYLSYDIDNSDNNKGGVLVTPTGAAGYSWLAIQRGDAYVYSGDKIFKGLTSTINGTTAEYTPGTKYGSIASTVYIVEELTIKQSVEQYITDAYTAIGNKSGTIPTQKNLANLAGAIGTISTGVDTSDATATSADILKDKTAYVKGAKVNGAIETYDGTVEDVPYTDCLTFTGETSEFTLKATYNDWDGTLQWSTDHNTWTTLAGTEAMQSVGKKLYLRGKGNTTFGAGDGVQWQLSAKAGCSGNIQTLLDWENPPTSISRAYCYYSMFLGCTNLTTAPELPATTLAGSCYYSMFAGCTSLTSAPELPATTLAGSCYDRMFAGCTSLTTAPDLPATTLADGCYSSMFNGCTSLTTAPNLPATILVGDCYYSMFRGCTNLTTAPELPATTLADSCYYSMFYGCTSLTTAPDLPATTLADGCYSSMFNGCTSLTTAPNLPATTLAEYCYYAMFNGCTKLKINTSSGNNIFTCPTTIPAEAVSNMFDNTGGTFTGTPTAGNTYYYTL